jgi:hypothetical protein
MSRLCPLSTVESLGIGDDGFERLVGICFIEPVFPFRRDLTARKQRKTAQWAANRLCFGTNVVVVALMYCMDYEI